MSKLSPMKKITVTLFFFLLLSACADENKEISERIEVQFNASRSVPINLALVGPPTWERVCVVHPYAMNKHVEKVLGFKWDAAGKTSIESNDGIDLLVFVKGKEVVAYTEHPRNKGDFLKVMPLCLTRDQSTLVRQLDKDGWVYLVTRQQTTTSH